MLARMPPVEAPRGREAGGRQKVVPVVPVCGQDKPS